MNDNTLFSILLVALGLLVGFIIAFVINSLKVNKATKKAEALINQARKDVEKIKRDAAIEQKEEAHKLKMDLDKEIREKKEELKSSESRLLQREANLDKRDEMFQKREAALDERDDKLSEKQVEIQNEKSKVEEIKREQLELLEKISGFSKEKARDLVMSQVKENMSKEIAEYIKEAEDEAKLTADKTARELIVTSMQKYAADIANDQTVTVVDLPSDEMKGRIIGREGRNIRTLETMTGVDLIIDDTPEAVILSAFDPVRREVARIALEKLIIDGRIHPARIEEMVEKAQKEVEIMIREEGEAAALETGVHGVHPELIKLLGRMKFRTSYGQNALRHSVEVSLLCGLLASEIGLDVRLAKRAGLLHDIGKSIDHETEGSHVQIGADLCRKYKESELIVNAVEAHHGDIEPQSLIACIVQAADAISAARPGARRETIETYTNRLKQLEDITNEFKGVDKSFAIQAGREIRIMVVPEQVSDADMVLLARDIAKQIEFELEYPGQIKVNVIRESRVTDYAK